MADEPEPGGWELLRGIKGLQDSVDKLAAGMVTQTVFTMFQAATTKDILSVREQAVRDANEAKAAASAALAQIEEMKATRARQNFTMLMTFITAVLGLGTSLVVLLVRGGGI